MVIRSENQSNYMLLLVNIFLFTFCFIFFSRFFRVFPPVFESNQNACWCRCHCFILLGRRVVCAWPAWFHLWKKKRYFINLKSKYISIWYFFALFFEISLSSLNFVFVSCSNTSLLKKRYYDFSQMVDWICGEWSGRRNFFYKRMRSFLQQLTFKVYFWRKWCWWTVSNHIFNDRPYEWEKIHISFQASPKWDRRKEIEHANNWNDTCMR